MAKIRNDSLPWARLYLIDFFQSFGKSRWKRLVKGLFYYLLYSVPKGNFPATSTFFSLRNLNSSGMLLICLGVGHIASAYSIQPNPMGNKVLQRRSSRLL